MGPNTLVTPAPVRNDDDGFTLIEILVVIIIIGILAAVAIPIFLNQQRTARDAATISDVRNLATSIEAGLAADPEATTFAIHTHETGGSYHSMDTSGPETTVWVSIGDAKRVEVSKTEGTKFRVLALGAGEPGEYLIFGYNDDGQEYTAPGYGSSVVYNSSKGGLQ